MVVKNKKHQRPPRLKGKRSFELGQLTESRVEGVIEWYKDMLPEWFVKIERSTKQEDEEGIDFWVYTADTERMPIQVKSGKFSKEQKKKYEERNIGVVVLNPSISDWQAYKKIMSRLNIMREADK